MSEPKPSPFVRLLPSLTDVAFLMPLVFLFARAGGSKLLLSDGDTGWHVRTGQWILANGRVPDHDIFSFSKAGEPWYAWEWLWDVTFGWLHLHAGMAAVIAASMLLISITFALLFRLVRRVCPNVLIAIAITIMATAGSAMHWLARPHLFTLLFTVIFYSILERSREGGTRLLLVLPLLTVLWTNLHGGFFVGIILIGCYAAGELASWLIEGEAIARRAALSRAKPYVLAALGCAAASLLNPYTYHLHEHMYRFLSGSFHLQYIEEYQSTSFQNILAFWYEPMVLLGALAAAWSFYRKRFAHAFLVAGWVHLALFSVRNMPIYLLVAAPVVAMMLYDLLAILAKAPVAGWMKRAAAGLQERAAEVGIVDRMPRVHLVSALTAVLLTGLFFLPSPPEKFRSDYDPAKYPAGALKVVKDLRSSSRIFTHDEWGDYLIYRLYPNAKVFVDGRFDFYGAKFTERYVDLGRVKYGWDKTLKEYGIDTVLLPVDASLASALKLSRDWRSIYDDGIAIVFRSVAPAVRDSLPGSRRASTVTRDSGVIRGRKIAISQKSDPRITKSNTRSEPL